jgi:lipid-binding SYLF domain-containing protein
MKKTMIFLSAFILLFLGASGSALAKKESVDQKRQEVDKMAKETLDKLLKENGNAKELYDKSYGHAIFHMGEVTFILSAGAGAGVAIEKGTGKHIYMRMGTGGIGIGLGVQALYTIFLFETKSVFDNFVDKGWDADASASAAAATAGANVQSSFHHGIATYQMTDKGLIAEASLKGTKYWKDKELNQTVAVNKR